MRSDDSGLILVILLVVNKVGPGLKLSLFCCYKRPVCTWEIAKYLVTHGKYSKSKAKKNRGKLTPETYHKSSHICKELNVFYY